MTIEELYLWAKANGCGNRQIVIIDPISTNGDYENKILTIEDITIPSDAELSERFYGTSSAVCLG